jgi:hypothetical protein
MIDERINLEDIKENCHFEKLCELEIVSFSYGYGRQFISQCKTCGMLVKKSIARDKLLNPEQIKPFDSEKFKSFELELKKLADLNHDFTKIRTQSLLLNQENRVKQFELLFNEDYVDFDSAYKKYINSDYWKVKRKKILERDNFKCRLCKIAEAKDIHHLSYRNLCNESDLELVSLCRQCHSTIHGLIISDSKLDEESPNSSFFSNNL